MERMTAELSNESQTKALLLGLKLRLLTLIGGVDRRAILDRLNFKAR
jgi:hypothetical protein